MVEIGNIVTGVFTAVLAKHSKSFSLIDCISVGVDRMQRNFEPMRQQVETWQRSELTDVTAKVVIYEAFVEGKLEAPKHLARTVHDLYFEPKYEEFRLRTIWSLSNAFTSAFKELDPIPQFKATAKLGEFLEARFSESFWLTRRRPATVFPNVGIHSIGLSSLDLDRSAFQSASHSVSVAAGHYRLFGDACPISFCMPSGTCPSAFGQSSSAEKMQFRVSISLSHGSSILPVAICVARRLTFCRWVFVLVVAYSTVVPASIMKAQSLD